MGSTPKHHVYVSSWHRFLLCFIKCHVLYTNYCVSLYSKRNRLYYKVWVYTRLYHLHLRKVHSVMFAQWHITWGPVSQNLSLLLRGAKLHFVAAEQRTETSSDVRANKSTVSIGHLGDTNLWPFPSPFVPKWRWEVVTIREFFNDQNVTRLFKNFKMHYWIYITSQRQNTSRLS